MRGFRPPERKDEMNFWDRLDALRAEWNVLEHPFYQRWSSGDLSREELALYSGQYRRAVVALARASATASAAADDSVRDHLKGHAAEESEHVELWDRFVDAVEGDRAAAPLPETERCAASWTGRHRSPEETLAALYAIEAAQPAIAAVKRDGLLNLYGFEPGPATSYFDVHATLDREHAASHRALLEERLGELDEAALLAAARDALSANWALLDGVESASIGGACAA